MGLTYTIAYYDDSEVLQTLTYASLSLTYGRKAIDFTPDSPEQDIKRFRVPGIDGNYLMRNGRSGGLLTFAMLYIGDRKNSSAANVDDLLIADMAALADRACTITLGTNTFTNCNLIRMRKSEKYKGTGVNSTENSPMCIVPVQAIFQRD
jgi:hypothetical protein